MRKSTIAPHKRLRAARLLRQGKSRPYVKRETGIHENTLGRWLRDDPDFISLVHGAGTLQVGPVRIAANHDAPILDETPDESLAWINPATSEVLEAFTCKTRLTCASS